MPNLNVDNFVKENVIDRIVRYLEPVKAEKRFRARAMLTLSCSYISASPRREQVYNLLHRLRNLTIAAFLRYRI